VDANLAVIAAAYDSVIDVTAAIGSPHRPTGSGRVPELSTQTPLLLSEEALP
jgi:hypothetical protein